MDIFFFFIFLLILTLCSGFFSASETALFSLSSTKIKAYQISPNKRRQLIAKMVLEPKDLLVTVFMLNTLVNILIQNTTSDMLGPNTGWIFKIGIPFVLMLFLGEIIPKYIGLENNIRIADAVATPINRMQRLLKPLRTLIVNITTPISRKLFFFLKKEPSISKEELQHVLNASKEHGVLDPDEADLISGYMHLQESSIKQLMQPCEDILFYDINEPLSKLYYLFIDQECSRLPVCNQSMDDILGMISAREFFLNRHTITDSNSLIPHLEKPLYIPENTPANALGKQLKKSKQIIALVVDEYGSISGLISQEDLVERVVGDISDLRDTKNLYMIAGPNEIIASGRLKLEDFNKYFHTNLMSPTGMMTIGGWLTEQMQGIPKSGTKFDHELFQFQILSADLKRIRRLYIRKRGLVPS